MVTTTKNAVKECVVIVLYQLRNGGPHRTVCFTWTTKVVGYEKLKQFCMPTNINESAVRRLIVLGLLSFLSRRGLRRESKKQDAKL